MLFLLFACTINVTKESPDLDSGPYDFSSSSTIYDSMVAVLTPEATFYTQAKNGQLYDVTYAGGGKFLVTNPLYQGSVGAVYSIDAQMGMNVELEQGASAVWEGSSSQEYMGVSVQALTDGTTTYVVTNQYGPNQEGHLLAAPVSSGSGTLESRATLNMMGLSAGDFLGTGVTVSGGSLLVSEMGPRQLFYAPVGLLATGGSLVNFATAPIAASQGDKFNFVDVDSGVDGSVFASYGGLFQHVLPDGTPDWWISEGETFGSGEPSPLDYQDRDIDRICNVQRHSTLYALSCYGGRYAASSMLVSPTGGLVNHYDYITSSVEGITEEGRYWRVLAFYDYLDGDENYGGYLQVEDGNGTVLAKEPIPMEAPYLCLPKLATDGVNQVALICHTDNSGSIFMVEVQ